MLIPGKKRMRDGLAPRYAGFRENVEAAHPSLLVVDVADGNFDAERFHVLPFKGHASVYGNAVIGELLAERIRTLAPYRELHRP